MCFDVASHLARMVLELALGCIKSVTDCDMQILMSMILGRIAPHDDFSVQHDQFDAHVIEVAPMVTSMAGLHHDAAGNDAVEELLQLGNPVTNLIFRT